MRTLLVGLGGGLGSAARYWLGVAIQERADTLFPYGTLTVNILGSFAIGAIIAWVSARGDVRPELLVFLTVGLCGGFTTMSAFSFDTVALVQHGALAVAAANVVVTIVACLAAVWLGQAAARLL
jgi:CrcB protein